MELNLGIDITNDIELNENEGLVYVDDIEKWQKCTILNIYHHEKQFFTIDRATVITTTETKLNRLVKYFNHKSQLIADRCVYIMVK